MAWDAGYGLTFLTCSICCEEFLVPDWVWENTHDQDCSYVCHRCPVPVGCRVYWVVPDYSEIDAQLRLFRR